jgi:hypothetical protein
MRVRLSLYPSPPLSLRPLSLKPPLRLSLMPRWTVYTRPGCTLCEAFLAELADMLGAAASAAVTVVDISDDDALERRYGTKIPVLTADGDFICAYHLDRERVAAYLDR